MRVAKPGPPDRQTWSPDLLKFTEVIDISEGRELKMQLDPSHCVYDVRAMYQDGHEIVVRRVNLCKTAHLAFTY